MKSKKIVGIIFSTLLFVTSIFAQRGVCLNNGTPTFNKGGNFAALNLSEAQRQKIEALKLNHQKMVLDIKNQIQKNRLTLKEMLLKDGLDKNLLTNLSAKNAKLRNKIANSRLAMSLKIYDLLNKEQKVLWKKRFLRMGHKFTMARKNMNRKMRPGMNKSMHRKMKAELNKREMNKRMRFQ